MTRRLLQASTALNRAVEAVLCLLALAMSALTLAQVVARYGLNHSIFWSEEVGRMILIALTFLGASAAWARGAHIGIDVAVARLPAGARRWVRAFGCACGIGFGVFLAVYGAEFTWFARRGVMSATGLSRSVPAAVVPLGGAALALHALADLAAAVTGAERTR
ncbi:TRAP transporter small permease [Deferrisoma camini]|uniref:TRAP transporter small permease n=1 Tax=Deferrisoma camini TaxID=1035120 RepID=UPI00046CAD72|nr:TRAP transporter small permease [Deferrisoma camini]